MFNKLLHISNIFFGNINSLKQVKLTFLVNQVSFTFDVRKILRVMTNKANLLTTADTPKRNNVIRLIGHYPTVISNATKWFKLPFNFLIQLISISNFGYLPYKHLRRKIERSLIGMIRSVMQFEIIKNLFLPRHIRNGIANSISLLHRVEKQVSLFISRQKFYFQCKFHNANIQIIFLYQKIFTNFVKQFKGVSVSLTSHTHFVMSGFHAPIL